MLSPFAPRRASGRATAALTALLLGSSLALTGCFGNPLEGLINQGIEGGINDIVENATGGLVDGSSGELPKDFPAEIPLIDGEIQGGFGINVEDSKSWTVVVKSPGGSVEDAAAHITDQLEAAGFEATVVDATLPGRSIGTYTKESLTVIVSVTTDDDTGGLATTYVVNRKN